MDYLQIDTIALPHDSHRLHQVNEVNSFVAFFENGSSLQVRNEFLYHIDRHTVQCQPSSGYMVAIDRILVAALLQIIQRKVIFIITEKGTGLFLTIINGYSMEIIGNQPAVLLVNLGFELVSILNGYSRLHFHESNQLLFIQINRMIAVLKIDCDENGVVSWAVVLTATHLMDRILESLLPPPTTEDSCLSIWSASENNETYILYADHSSVMSVIPVSDPLSLYTRESSYEVQTAFLTALSSCTSRCEVGVSADALGTLTVWVYEAIDDEEGDINHQGQHCWLELFSTDTCCDKHRVSTLILEANPLRLYIGDDRGMVLIASISLKAQSLHILHELTLFPPNHSPTYIHFTPLQPQGLYRIRAFSNSCGEGYEALVPRSAAAVTRLWPETLSTSSIAAAVVLPDLHMVVAADWSGSVHICDLQNHGAIVVSFLLPLDQCLIIAATSLTPPPKNEDSVVEDRQVIRIVSGHRNGEVCLAEVTIIDCVVSALQTASTTARTTVKDDNNTDKNKKSGAIEEESNEEEEDEDDESSESDSQSDEESRPTSTTNSQSNSRYSRQSSTRMLSKAHRNNNLRRRSSASTKEKEEGDVFELLQSDNDHNHDNDKHSIDSFSLQRLQNKRPWKKQYEIQGKSNNNVQYQTQRIESSQSILPVSDIFFSSSGSHVLVLHARKHFVLYEWSSAAPTEVIFQYSCKWTEEAISNITLIHSTQNLSENRLWLAIQQSTTKTIVLFDGLQLKPLTEIHLPTSPAPSTSSSGMQGSVLWDHIEENSSMRVLQGLCASQLSRWFTLDEQDGLKPVAENLFTQSFPDNVIEEGVIGLESFSPIASNNESGEQAPIVVAWSMKRVILLRLQLPTPSRSSSIEVTRVKQYSVKSLFSGSSVKMVHAKALRAVPWVRNHRAVVILSNGFAVTLHL